MNSIKIETLQEFFKNKEKYLTNTIKGHQGVDDYNAEGEQGEYNETFKFYKHPEFPINIFFRETYLSDSYGDNASIESFDLVEGKEKLITVYEPIN